jgi:hypothetical protein
MRRLARQVQAPPLRQWQARPSYAAAGLLVLFLFVGGALEAVQRMRTGGGRQQLTGNAVRAFAFAGFPQWAKANPERTCPTSLTELTPWMTSTDTIDIWGSPYQWSCFRWQGGWRLRAWSLGEDQLLGTPDDVWSDR